VKTADDERTCSQEGCGRPHASLGLCATHYKAHQRKRGIQRTSTRTCDADGCGRDHYAQGLCRTHYGQENRDRWIGTCTVDECSRRAHGRYCDSHARRQRTGRMDVPIQGRNQTGCLFDGCDGEHFRLGMCRRHFRGGRVDRSKAGGDSRDRNLRWKYDITLAEREALFIEQGDVCAICEEAEPNDIDYDHSHHCADPLRDEHQKRGCRDCVRGGLCQRCNIALAAYEDGNTRGGAAELLGNPAWRMSADTYLKQRPFEGTEGTNDGVL
jgi:Recombination endonuclease VII